MPILHMETDLVRGVGYQLQQTSSTLHQESQQLTASVQNLIHSWQGNSATIFMGEIQPLLQQLSQFAEASTILNQRLQREIDEWEFVAAELGVGISTLSTDESGQQIAEKGNLFDNVQERLTWLADHSKWAELGLGLYGFSGLQFVLGSSYLNQVIVHGSRFNKELAGLSTHLTHVSGTNMSSHILRQAGQVTGIDAAFAFLQVVPQWMVNYREYGDDPVGFAVANFVDTLGITGVGLGAVYLGGMGGAKLGGVIGFAVGGPVGAAAGAVIGGIAGKFVAGWMADEWISKPFLESDLRHNMIDQGTEFVKDAGSTIKNSLDDAANAIENIRLPNLKFSW